MQTMATGIGRKNINYIVENDLCIRCGGCVAACPYNDVISLDGSYFPSINNKCYTHQTCTVCLKVCPVSDINLPILYQHVHGVSVDLNKNYLGPFRDLYVGHSTVPQIRERGSSGGVITQLLISLLESGEIDGAIVATSATEHGKPWSAEGAFVTRKEEIIRSSGSKYTIAPINAQLKALKEFPGKIALVGLPCHIQSFRMWEALNSRVSKRVTLVIGVICSITLEMEAITQLIQKSGFSLDTVDDFRFRTGSWPGKAKVKHKNGEQEDLRGVDMIEAFRYLSKFYYPQGCLNCVDYAADLADISIGDPWIRGPNGDHLFKEGWSLIAVRTDRGAKATAIAQSHGDLVLRRIPPSLWIRNQEGMAKTKRRRALFRIKQRQRRGKIFPNYHWDATNFSVLESSKHFIFDGFLALAKNQLCRNLFTTLMCSNLGELVTRTKQRVKRWRYRSKYRRDVSVDAVEDEALDDG